jgi:hypothetical protein
MPLIRRSWTPNNDGTGSGLDADLLDGQHGAYYAPVTHTHTVVGVLPTVNISTVTTTVIDSWAVSSYYAAKYLIHVQQGAGYYTTELLVTYTGVSSSIVEYAIITSNEALVDFSTDVSAGTVRLNVTMTSATAATIRVISTPI